MSNGVFPPLRFGALLNSLRLSRSALGLDVGPLQGRHLQGLCLSLGFNPNYPPDLAPRIPTCLGTAVSCPLRQAHFCRGSTGDWRSIWDPCLLAAHTGGGEGWLWAGSPEQSDSWELGPEQTATPLPWALSCHLQAVRPKTRGLGDPGLSQGHSALSQDAYEDHLCKRESMKTRRPHGCRSFHQCFDPRPRQDRHEVSSSGSLIINARPVSLISGG